MAQLMAGWVLGGHSALRASRRSTAGATRESG